MCLRKVYYNTYADGAQDITEKTYTCREGRGCSHPVVRRYDRTFPFTKLGDPKPESHRSLSERKPTPYSSSHTPRGSKSPSPSGRRDSGVYMSGAIPSKHYHHHHDPYGYDLYGYPYTSSRHDPRDRYDREPREPKLKRSSTAPQIVYMDRDKSRSSRRDYSRDIPLGPVPLADDYGRRRIDDPVGYTFIHDADDRRRQRREQRRMSTSSYTEPSALAAAAMDRDAAYDPHRYLPRRASTVVHHSDGTVSASGTRPPKQLRWEDQVVRAKRERQNAEIASRPPVIPGHEPKGILKHTGGDTKGDGKGKGKEKEKSRDTYDDMEELRRAVERMDIPRGRDRQPRGYSDWDGAWAWYDGDYELGRRRKRSKEYTY
ncbi:hypothetical protein VTK56DRAFT_5125 [Thermocarpiscus australiensis]